MVLPVPRQEDQYRQRAPLGPSGPNPLPALPDLLAAVSRDSVAGADMQDLGRAPGLHDLPASPRLHPAVPFSSRPRRSPNLW